jgi:hypothetical protein
MGYARLPETFPFEDRVVRAGNCAVGALARMLPWIAANRTDCFVPKHMAALIASESEIDSLLAASLATPVNQLDVRVATGRISSRPDVEVVMPSDGLWLPDYLTWNVSATEEKEASEKAREAGRASGAARRESARDRS